MGEIVEKRGHKKKPPVIMQILHQKRNSYMTEVYLTTLGKILFSCSHVQLH